MTGKGINVIRKIGLFLAICLICPCLPALADGDCWYYLEHGEHDYEQVDIQLPSCETDGYYMLECRQCGKHVKHITDKAYGHAWMMTESVGSTCDKKGYEKYVCDRCGDTKTTTFPKLSHDWKDGEVLEIATCTSTGSVRTYCTLCHVNNNRIIEKTPHEYGGWSVTLPATDHSQGMRRRSCDTCGHTDSESFYPDGTLYRGMDKCDDVVDCQKMLIELGFLKDKADGVFGKKTQQAVKDFQTFAGLEVSGIAYPQTLEVLFNGAADSPAEVSSDAQLPEFYTCSRYQDETGADRIGYCPYHAGVIAGCEEKENAAQTDEDRLLVLEECRVELQAEVERLYDTWFAGASEQDKPGIAQAKSMFLLYLRNQESMWMAHYAGQPIVIKQHLINALTEQCVDLCALAVDNAVLTRFSFSHSGTSIDDIYTYSVVRTEQGYQAEYDLFSGRIIFSLPMDGEDIAELTAIAKGLAAWNGFSETNQDALDGEGFGLLIEYEDGSAVSASGSNGFPQGYSEHMPDIKAYFLNLMEKNEIGIDE